jgi:hypothetical protein
MLLLDDLRQRQAGVRGNRPKAWGVGKKRKPQVIINQSMNVNYAATSSVACPSDQRAIGSGTETAVQVHPESRNLTVLMI